VGGLGGDGDDDATPLDAAAAEREIRTLFDAYVGGMATTQVYARLLAVELAAPDRAGAVSTERACLG
jgi:hypothetical protein